jgi:hypothetical protein
MIVKLDEKDAALSIGSTAFEVVVSCEVSGIYTASQEGKMRSGSSSYEDLQDVPAEATFDAEDSTCTVVVLDEGGIEVGTLKLRGVEWFDLFYDDENVIEQIDNS